MKNAILTTLLSISIVVLAACERNQAHASGNESLTDPVAVTQVSISMSGLEMAWDETAHTSYSTTFLLNQSTLTESNRYMDGTSDTVALDPIWVKKAEFLVKSFPNKYLGEEELGYCWSAMGDAPCLDIVVYQSNGEQTTLIAQDLPKDLTEYGEQADKLYFELINRDVILAK